MLWDMKNKVILSVKDNLVDTIAEFIDPALALAWQTLRLQFQLGDALQINLLLCTTISQHWHEGGHWHWRIHFKGKRPQEPLWLLLGEPIPERTLVNLLLNKLPHSYEDVIQNLSTMDVMPSLRGQAPSWSLSTIVWRGGTSNLKTKKHSLCNINMAKNNAARGARGAN